MRYHAAVSKSFAHPVMLSANTEMGPAIDDVVEVLQEHDIGVESRSFEVWCIFCIVMLFYP